MRIPITRLPLRGMFAIVARLPQYVRLSFRLMSDSRVPLHLKLVYAAIILYVVSPFDLIPEFVFPPLGYAEDIVLFLIGLHNLIKFSPAEVVKEHAEILAKKREAKNQNRSEE
ncbi:MAG: DUF1232 domain-containing protein [Candidatus Latescibacterota bacterium]|nr:DUF1232 domain-containing protein [Candidatus Latescibacterota bacterium]